MKITLKAQVRACEAEHDIGLVRRPQYCVSLKGEDGTSTKFRSDRPFEKNTQAEIVISWPEEGENAPC